jgi:hypothetical protein
MLSDRATEKKLIFTNLLNGVSVVECAKAFNKKTEKEVMDDFNFVALKIKSYIFVRVMPYIPLDTVAEAQANKLQVLALLEKVNLEIVPAFKSFTTYKPEEAFS